MFRLTAKLAVFCALLSTAIFAGTIDISLPGVSGTNIAFTVANNDGFDITKITFDLSNTLSNAPANPPLVIDPPTFAESFSVDGAPVGSFTFFNTNQFVFGFTFTGFNNGDVFLFNMDPDIAGNSAYGADISELVGTLISVDTTGGTVSGALSVLIGQDGARYVGASIPSPTEIPEPSTYLLLAAGLGAIRLWKRRA